MKGKNSQGDSSEEYSFEERKNSSTPSNFVNSTPDKFIASSSRMNEESRDEGFAGSLNISHISPVLKNSVLAQMDSPKFRHVDDECDLSQL